MTKTNKTLLTLIFAGLLTICAGFALLLSRPAAQAKAEGSTETPTYSETWVIKEKWQPLEEASTGAPTYWDIAGKAGDVSFKQFYYINVNPAMFFIVNDATGTAGKCIAQRIPESDGPNGTTEPAKYSFENIEEKEIPYSEWKDTFGKITFYEDTSAEKFSVLRTWLNSNAVKQTSEEPAPVKYTLTFKDGENVLGTAEAAQGDKLSALDISAISTTKEGYTFKGWSYTENGDVLDLEAETVTENKTLYAVYEKNAEPTEPTDPANPTNPENPDKDFGDKVKDFGEKASTWIKDNIGVSISGGAVVVILIVAAVIIFSKRR